MILSENTFDKFPNLFIVGVQRSGTTLLRLLLNNHSLISIPEEASFLMPVINRKRLLDEKPLSFKEKKVFVKYLLNNYQFKKWKLESNIFDALFEFEFSLKELIGYLYYSFAMKNEKSICGDKTPSFIRKLNILAESYPNTKFIHIVRDGRDVYLSLKDKSHPVASNLSLASFEWNYKIKLINENLHKYIDRVIEIRYEDLLLKPEIQLQRTCSFLDIDFEEGMLDFWKNSNRFIDRKHSDLIFKPINSNNIYKWKNALIEWEIKKYNFFSRKALYKYSYTVNMSSIKFYDKIIFCLDLLINLPKRIIRIFIISFYMKIAKRFGLRTSEKFYK